MVELPAALVRAIAEAAAEAPSLVSAWVYGSTARGAERPRDLDLALLWDAGVPTEALHRAAERFALGVERRMPARREVEVVDLRRATPELQQRVLTEGIRVFERDRVQRARFEAQAASMAADYLEFRRPYLERWRRAVARGR